MLPDEEGSTSINAISGIEKYTFICPSSHCADVGFERSSKLKIKKTDIAFIAFI
jgi:hypothetical protein